MSVPTLSLISDQMQKHLLSSTMLGSSRASSVRPAGSGSPSDICTTSPAISFVPSPSPFNNITDLGALDGEVSLGSKLQSPLVHYEEAQPGQTCGAKLGSGVLQQQISFNSNPPPPSPVSRLQQISFNPPPPPPVPPMSAQPDVKLLLMESSPSSIPNSLALLTPEPISIIQPSSGPRYNVTASSNSSISQEDYSSRSNTITTNLIHPNKKKRLLTFLTEQENNQIILAPSKSDQILFNSGKSDEILINSAKTEAINATPAPTLFLQPCVNSMADPNQTIEQAKQEQAATLIINQTQRTKTEPTLIINPDSMAATLIAPVSGPATLPLLTPCISSNMLGQEARTPFSNSAPVTNYTLVQSPNLDILPVNFAAKPANLGHNLKPIQPQQPQSYEQYCEKVTCFKCKLCGVLVLSQAALRHHILDDHEEVVDEEDSVKESDWVSVALKHKIQICCSLCTNKFNSGRSFKVHMAEDHGLSDSEAERELDKINKERKEKSIKVMREEKLKAKEERRKKRRVSFEAYIDGNNELKIRMPSSITTTTDLNTPRSVPLENNSEFEKNVKDNKVMKPNQDIKEKEDGKNETQLRKKISKKENNIYKCEFSECQVECADLQHLRLHEKSHSGSGFHCPFSCSRKANTTKTWALMKIHLWRAHKLDLGLLRCLSEGCTFVTSSKAKLERHQTKHQDTKPWLCPLCGKAFQLAKQLRAHTATHSKPGTEGKLTCQKCKSTFSSPRQLRLHIDSVHHKKRNYLCSFCGYSASSRSALKLHTRKHTGDKPFRCDSCQYTSSDHNSLRRHKMRHSGLRPYNCPYCPYSSIQSTTYKVHLKNKHAIEDVSNILFQCKRCDFKTLKENIYLAHVVLHE